MEVREHQLRRPPRTMLTLENWLRMAFYPKGAREFMGGVNYELGLGPIQSSMNEIIGTSYDITKYIAYTGIIGLIRYEFFK